MIISMRVLTLVASLAFLSALPSTTSAQTWTVNAPTAGGNYYYLNIATDVTYDWGNGTAASTIDYDIINPNIGNSMGALFSGSQSTVGTKITLKGTLRVQNLPGNGQPATVVFTAKDILGRQFSQKTVAIILRPTP